MTKKRNTHEIDLTEMQWADKGLSNEAFVPDQTSEKCDERPATSPDPADEKSADGHERATWGNPIEFLMSCISMSVGLGNVWRFPFTAYENGGGAFLIPYLIVLLLVGKPLYFLEMIMGQFASRGSVEVWHLCPILKGIGYGQTLATWFIITYYCSLMALTVFYFVASFNAILPWTQCDDAWADERCFPSGSNLTGINSIDGVSSVDQYFKSNVLNKLDSIDDGVGVPEWRLTVCLLFSWICVCLILIKGVASSGKAAYFTAIFPYVVLITLLVRGVTLPGATDGMIYFIRPRWDKILTAKVWYAAVTQCFFSLSVGSGPIVSFASHNAFRHTIYRDAAIVSGMDTFTSLLAGFTIFSILGNLAHETGKDIEQVVQGGTGLAFISYPDAIGKFDVVPQLFAVLFFLMLFTLGVGSAVSLTACVVTAICDAVPRCQRWIVTVVISLIGFLIGLVYITPGGQYVLNIVDFFGGGFIVFVLATMETATISWVYGLKRFLEDIEFMLGIRLSLYWRFTWGFFIPVALSIIFVYSLVTFEAFREGDYFYPVALTASGWMLAVFALIQVPVWAVWVVCRRKESAMSWMQAVRISFRPSEQWGPKDPKIHAAWIQFRQDRIESGGQMSTRLVLPGWLKTLFKCDSQRITSSDTTATHSSPI